MASRPADAVLGDTAPELATAALALARRFARGATLWCWAPGAHEHAQHVAVEFVHPVVVGTRALPAAAVLDDDAATTLRPIARAGDVLLVVGGTRAGTDAPVARTLQRAAAWGLTTMWIGAGPRPPARGAVGDHVLWVSDDASACHDGRLVLGYHLLWELTQVCFEHPGLLDAPAGSSAACVTCADEGRLAEVVRSHDDTAAAVRTASGVELVNTLMVGPVSPGDLLVVHAGAAISRVEA